MNLGIEIIKQILTSDIIGWGIGVAGAVFGYLAIHNMQLTIERHNIINDVEQQINELFSKEIAKSNRGIKEGKLEQVTVRTVLHDKSKWVHDGKIEALIENGQRYIQIRTETESDPYVEYISTQALHESMIWFRRVHKLYCDGILKPIDLADMWREILPFGASGRLEFYSSYFDKSDIRSIIFVVMNTAISCKTLKRNSAMEYFKEHYYKNPGIEEYYRENISLSIKHKRQRDSFFNSIKI
ncbi:MAG: hypothetical protein K0R93_672 [Anaerosolibacter sp.]|uniref:hypothetical protein n=1 Tax=Anaerosolibacter sp. TaxID=1872527 RepID=UPI00263715C7|nr:hypothetical protein [Anaerosolibacter sp.]MDF2545774.1 hypothetical protein [Anaerosolibacter sp.]